MKISVEIICFERIFISLEKTSFEKISVPFEKVSFKKDKTKKISFGEDFTFFWDDFIYFGHMSELLSIKL